MKKVLPSIALLAIVMFLSGSCSKKNDSDECQTCKAFDIEGQVIDEETVCSESAETTFRSQNEGRSVKCD
jgi:hypothetical protein